MNLRFFVMNEKLQRMSCWSKAEKRMSRVGCPSFESNIGKKKTTAVVASFESFYIVYLSLGKLVKEESSTLL